MKIIFYLFTVFLFFLTSFPVNAQNFVSKIDYFLQKRYSKVKYDTLYVTRPKKRLLVMLKPNISYIGMTLLKDSVKVDFNTVLKHTFSLNIGYSGLVVGYRFKIGNMAEAFIVRYYGRKFGFDLDICKTNNLQGTLTNGQNETKINSGFLNFGLVEFLSYYVVNGKKFSYPAAFTKSYFQKKSCGSMLFGASFVSTYSENSDASTSLSNYSIGLGAGYGYNFVKNDKWLIHISALPALVVTQKNVLTANDFEQEIPYKPNFIISGKFSVSYNLERWFFGLDGVAFSTILGTESVLQATYQRNITRMFVGLRF